MSLSAPGPSPSPTVPRPPHATHSLRSPHGLATAATTLLSLGAAVDLFTSVVDLYSWNLRGSFISAPTPADPGSPVLAGDLAFVDSLVTGTGFLRGLLYVATAVVFVLWFRRVRCNGEVFRPDGFSQSAGWAVGGWFVPVANVFFPYRTARETWDASTRYAPDGSYRQVSGAPVVAWWVVFVAGQVMGWFATRKYWAAETAEAVRDADLFAAVTDLTTVVAAVLAIVFVRKLTAMQHVKAVQGPNAAV